MGDSTTDAKSFSREGFKEFWRGSFSFLDNYTRFIDQPLPRWSSSDVDEFIASDPVHGTVLKTAQEAANFGITGSVIGAVSTAAISWKYSKSLHGAGLSFLAGGVFGWTFGSEVANHWMQLYRLNTLAAQTKFMEWWQNKGVRQS